MLPICLWNVLSAHPLPLSKETGRFPDIVGHFDFTEFVAGKESERSSGLPPGRNSLRFKGKRLSVMSAGDRSSYPNQS